MSESVVHNETSRRFEFERAGDMAVLEYRLRPDAIEFTHTGVPDSMGGQGVGSLLVRTGLEHAREAGLKIIPTCSFVARYLERHPEYQQPA